MAITRDSIRARFPGAFASTAEMDTVLDAAIAEASRRVSTDRLGARAGDAITYLSAHLAEITKPGRASGIQSQTVGPITTTYGTRADGASTAYEALYLDVLRSSGPGMTLAL